MLLEKKNCLQCNKPLEPDMRKDARFCNLYCRTAFNNQKRFGTPVPPEVIRVDKILHKNYDILKRVMGIEEGYVKITKKELEAKGFKPDFFTQIRGTAYKYCYTFSFREDKDGYSIGHAPDHVMKDQFEKPKYR